MSAGHIHALPTGQNQKYLLIALGLTSTFLIAEVVAGFITGSLALLSDAAHKRRPLYLLEGYQPSALVQSEEKSNVLPYKEVTPHYSKSLS